MKYAATLMSLASATLSEEDPIGSVVGMLKEMIEQGSAAKHEEEEAFGKFKEFCEGTLSFKAKAIKDTTTAIDGYRSQVDAAKAVLLKQENVMHVQGTNIMHWTNDKISLDKVREVTNAAHQKEHTDYAESIAACESAIQVLGGVPKQVTAVSPIPVLLQQDAPAKVGEDQWSVIKQALIEKSQQPAQGSPYAIEASSGSVIEVLENIRDKLVAEQHDLEVAEINEQGKHDKKYSMLTSEIANSESIVAAAKEVFSKASVKEGVAQRHLDDAKASKADDMQYSNTLETECETKAGEYVQRQQNRADEITAMTQAVEILSSDDVQVSKDAIVGTAPTSFLQLGSSTPSLTVSSSSVLGQITSFLKDQPQTRSITTVLASVVQGSPFDKVEKLIKDLIDRLTAETESDADHRAYCEKEVGKNNERRTMLNHKLASLNATREELTASIESLTDHVNELSSEITELTTDMETAAKTRRSESKANAKTMEESKAAADAVAQAISVLESMYSKIGAPASFVQASQEPIYADFGGEKTYNGFVGQKVGVIGILRMIESSFTKLFSETSVDEKNAEDMHTKFMRESDKSLALKNGQHDKFSTDKAEAEQDLATLENDYLQTHNLLEDAIVYMTDLDKQCVAPSSYSERMAARQSEIKSLQTALKILGQSRP